MQVYPQLSETKARQIHVAFWLLTISGLWLITRPYMGIWHDARLYSVEALARLQPGVFDRDLFLAYGSQGQFTVFPAIYAALIDLCGLEIAALGVTLLGKLVWLVALVVLARRLIPSPYWLFGVLLVLAYPSIYDGFKIFSYGESFATPRIFAEALSFLALTAWLTGRPIAAWGAIVAATLLHPLMAIAGAVILGVMSIARLRSQQIALLMSGVACLSLLVGFVQFPEIGSRLFSVFDPEWLEVVLLRNPYVFLDQWNATAFGRAAMIGVILGLAVREGPVLSRKLAFIILAVLAALLFVSWLGTTAWRNVLLTQLQLWRGLWLGQVFSLLLLGELLPRYWHSSYKDRVLASCLASSLLLDTWAMGLMAIAGVALRFLIGKYNNSIDSKKIFWRALPYSIIAPWLLSYLMAIPYWVLSYKVYMDQSVWRTILGDFVVMVSICAALYWVMTRIRIQHIRSLTIFTSAFFLVSLFGWGWRTDPPNRESWKSVYARLKQDIPPGSVVANSTGSASLTWFDLGRANYISQIQTAGVLFNRDTAIEGVRRLKIYEQTGFAFGSLDWIGRKRYGGAIRVMTHQSIMTLCDDAGVDYVIVSGKWDLAKPYFKSGRQVLSMFECKNFRINEEKPMKT